MAVVPVPQPGATGGGPAQERTFQIQLEGLIQLLAQNLYADPDVFLREMVQNAHDSINRRAEQARERGEPAPPAPRIQIVADAAAREIQIHDNGSGLTAEEIDSYLSTIGRSGTGELRQRIAEADRNYTVQALRRRGRDFSTALRLNPGYAWALAERGESYRLLGQHAVAIADLSGAIALDPTDSWAFCCRGTAYRQAKRYPEAVADLTTAIGLKQDCAWALASAARHTGCWAGSTRRCRTSVRPSGSTPATPEPPRSATGPGTDPSATASRAGHSFRAVSGPVIRLSSGRVEPMTAREAASPAATVR